MSQHHDQEDCNNAVHCHDWKCWFPKNSQITIFVFLPLAIIPFALTCYCSGYGRDSRDFQQGGSTGPNALDVVTQQSTQSTRFNDDSTQEDAEMIQQSREIARRDLRISQLTGQIDHLKDRLSQANNECTELLLKNVNLVTEIADLKEMKTL